MYHKVDFKRFLIADLKPYHESGPRWIRTIAKSIQKHREAIEQLLNQRICLNNHPYQELRLATDNHSLYLWHRNTRPDHWLNLLNHEHFYFDTTNIKTLLIEDAKKHFNTTGTGLSRITLQLTDHKGDLTHPQSKLGDHTLQRPYLTGESLHLLLDATNRDFKDIQLFITRIGRDTHGFKIGGIHNPRFPQGKERDHLFARLIAIAFSDGHIHRQSRQFSYIENNYERREYINNLMKSLGEVYFAHDKRLGADRLNMPVTIGRLLERLGVPAGDKHLSPHYRLPKAIREGSKAVKCAYLEEVIPEDGYFHTHHGPKFGIKRAQILDAGQKADQYDFKSKISIECKEFIIKRGETRQQKIRDEPTRKVIILVWGKLVALSKSNSITNREIAIQLRKSVEMNPCLLLVDEKQLCESLGIKMSEKIKEVHLHQSGRISVIWEIHTQNKDDAKRWAKLAMPSSDPKQTEVIEWLAG
jgi:hypothetical protein